MNGTSPPKCESDFVDPVADQAVASAVMAPGSRVDGIKTVSLGQPQGSIENLGNSPRGVLVQLLCTSHRATREQSGARWPSFSRQAHA
jgi:hypothetical protein